MKITARTSYKSVHASYRTPTGPAVLSIRLVDAVFTAIEVS